MVKDVYPRGEQRQLMVLVFLSYLKMNNVEALIVLTKIDLIEDKTIIDRIEGDYYIGRTEFDSPDVDTEVLVCINEEKLVPGNFYNVRINDATEFDLMGSVEK